MSSNPVTRITKNFGCRSQVPNPGNSRRRGTRSATLVLACGPALQQRFPCRLLGLRFADSVDIEKFFFGEIDAAGMRAVETFSTFAHQPIDRHILAAMLHYMSAQKLRTPKGLFWLLANTSARTKNVMEIESWVMADRERFARFLGVAEGRVPLDPDAEAQPKELIVSLASNSKLKEIRSDLVPRTGDTRIVGPAYNPRLTAFVETTWRLNAAALTSRSLRKAVHRLRAAF